MKPKPKTRVSLSVEKLSHFRCGSCKKWWSIGDAPAAKKEWYCPWCGERQAVARAKA